MYDIPKSISIKKIITETPFVKTFVFEHTLNSKPGQFVLLWIPRLDEKPISVAYDGGNEFHATIFAVGPFSKKMHELKEGDLVGVRGPYGSWFKYEKGQRLILVGGGYGAAPLYNLAEKASADGCKIDFIVGARSSEHLLFLDRIKALPGVTLHIATDDGSVGEKGFNTLILARLIAEQKTGEVGAAVVPPIDCVYTCGPEIMMKKISDMCHDAGINAQVSIERYMKCGFGVCGQCCVDASGERMCKEGPVVSNERARMIIEFGKYHRDSVGKIKNY
jgi:dihydroorotate dehydrogenase electron transfer subunit